ncbi:hypothetical protein B0J12DRAFT_736537 [Macrophomina phaseolina]|uniref:Pentatricopeptide repeat protein n=1 Tax=Macrophomina phaseolina TaxID=35725 RepID=A0ABQ8GRU6_9PEZI|nr:hypothetical protein B0J12DRAFT_736537 [Macrophomina phaseolina]
MRAIFHQFARRAYSTSEEDYLVEEDEEKAILAKSGEESRPETTQLMHLMNPDFRQLRRLEFLLKSSNTPPTTDMDQLLQRANCFPPLDDFPQQDVWWIKKFARLNAVYDVRLPVELRSSQLEINALTEQIVKLLLHRGRDVDSIRCSWIADIRGNYSEEGKRNVWGEIMLWLLHHDHDAVLPALEATARGRKSPSYVIADILEQFMSNCLQNSEVGQSSLPSTLLPTLTILLERIPYLGRALSQKFFHLTLVHSTIEQGLELWSLLRENGFRPSWHTYYHLAYFFGRHGQYVKALEALKRPIELGAPPTHWAFLATCAQVLRSSATEAQAYHASSSILAEFIKMGVHLNVYLYTVIMHNAVDHGDVQTALNIFSLLREKGIEPNDYTYTVLLKGLKDGGNQDALRDVIREAGEALPKLSRPEVVATDILHCVYLNHFEPACSERTFIDLAQTYQEYFDPLPLIRLGVPARLFGKQRSLQRLNIPPPHQSIGIVLSAYLELVSRNEPEEVVRLYRIFRQRIDNLEDGYKLSSLRKNSYFYNAFLLALGQHPSTLQLMPELLRHMVDKRIHSAPLATEHTWDILVNAFMRHKQPEAADRVVQMISSYGQEPTEVTWNSLVRGYGRMQDIDKILDTIRQMQLRRIDLSDYSLRVLGMMKESDKLSQGLREMEDVRRRKVEEEMDYLVPEDYQEELAEGKDKEEGIQGESMNKEDVEGKWRDDECVLGALEKNHKDPIQNSR